MSSERIMSKRDNYISCEECFENIDSTTRWCTPCNAKRFESNFPTWTSNSKEMDIFIQKTQITAQRYEHVLQWVDPSKFTSLEKTESSKNKKGYWKDGYLLGWNSEKNEWDRKGGQWVKLVTHCYEKYLTSGFLKPEYEFSKVHPSERLVYGITRDQESNEYAIIEKLEERCLLCNREWMSKRWCRGCYTDHFISESNNWTSGNPDIDAFILEAQVTAELPQQVLTWIPESDLTGFEQIGQGGYGTVFKSFWKLGRIRKRDFIANKWEREEPINVALKSIEEEEGSTVTFLRESKAMSKCLKNDMYFLDFYGISRHPENGKYLMVIRFVAHGDLRKYLVHTNFTNNSWKHRIDKLWSLALDLRTLHSSGLVHRDIHSGNVLFGKDRRSFIADFGLACEEGKTQGKDVKGVLPYVAPEVLCQQPSTKASDIYSFGMIMWEFVSCQTPFSDRAYDYDLALEIHSGLRPPNIKGTPKCYAQLMKQCWDAKPSNRPTTQDLAETIEKWHQILEKYDSNCDDEDISNQFRLAEEYSRKNPLSIKPYSMKSHPLAILTSKVLPTVSLQTVTKERVIPGYQTQQYDLTLDEYNANEDGEDDIGEDSINEANIDKDFNTTN